MTTERTHEAFQTLSAVVIGVARRQRQALVWHGAARILWQTALPLLMLVLLQVLVPLPFYVRLPALPLVAGAVLWRGWRLVVMPWRRQYSLSRAAMLVEFAKPELDSQLVTAVEVYADTQRDRPRFSPAMTSALITSARDKLRAMDLDDVVDLRPCHRHLTAATVVLLLWVCGFALIAAPFCAALGSLVTAWGEARDQTQRLAGATIVIDPPAQAAYLRGSEVRLHGRQEGFSKPRMSAFVRPVAATMWQEIPLTVATDGSAWLSLPDVQETFDCYFAAGVITSRSLTIPVTEAPRIVKLTVEYQFPDYARRAPIVQARSDGDLRALFGSTVVLQIEANKDLASASLRPGFGDDELAMAVGGRFARGVLRLDREEWLADERDSIPESYRLTLIGPYGYSNEDRGREYALEITRDQAPTIAFKRLPHRSPAHEPHIVDSNLAAVALSVAASDDYGVARIDLHYRLESLDTGMEKSHDVRTLQFPLPKTEVPILTLMRLSDLGAAVGDRIVFWAETADAYDLGPQPGPHTARTPAYRVAVVTEEDLFNEIVYRDTWETQWYDELKIAQRGRRSSDARRSPGREPAAQVLVRMLERSTAPTAFSGRDQLVIQDYFNSLNLQE